MPIGGKPGGVSSQNGGPPPRLLAHGPGVDPAIGGDLHREHWIDEIGGPLDIWQPWVVTAADLIAGNKTADVILVAGAVTRLTVLERNGSPTLIGFARVPFSGAGGYDLIHPGNGALDFGIPATQRFNFRLEAGAPVPTKDLWVLFRAGIHTIRTV